MHTCVSRCGAVTVSQCGLSGWESIGSTPQQDTGKPALQIHAHNTSDKPEGGKKKRLDLFTIKYYYMLPNTKTQYKDFLLCFPCTTSNWKEKKEWFSWLWLYYFLNQRDRATKCFEVKRIHSTKACCIQIPFLLLYRRLETQLHLQHISSNSHSVISKSISKDYLKVWGNTWKKSMKMLIHSFLTISI